MSIITMTTVGYGDFYPKSFPAKMIGIFGMFFGVFIVSLFVIMLENLFYMEGSDLRAYDLLMRLQGRDRIELQSANVLARSFKV